MRETTPRDIAKVFGAKPQPSPFDQLELGRNTDLLYLSRISRNITNLYSADERLRAEVGASEKKTIKMGVAHVMDRVVEAWEQKGEDPKVLIPMREATLGRILQQFINNSLDYHTLNLEGSLPDGIVSIRDLRIVMHADGLTGKVSRGSEIAAMEHVSSSKKLDLLDNARTNFTQAMVNWMLTR